jgi:hypothetical protein
VLLPRALESGSADQLVYLLKRAIKNSCKAFPLGLELGVAALRRRRTRRLHYSMSSWQ